MDSDSSHTIEVTVEAPAWNTAVTDPEKLCRRAVAAVLAQEPRSSRSGGEVSVLLTDDARMAELNRTYRGKDSPINVLSFPSESLGTVALPDQPLLLGDIVVALETARREALT